MENYNVNNIQDVIDEIKNKKMDNELIVAYTSCVLAMLVTDMANDITNSIKNLIIVFNYKDYVFRDFKDNWYCP